MSELDFPCGFRVLNALKSPCKQRKLSVMMSKKFCFVFYVLACSAMDFGLS